MIQVLITNNTLAERSGTALYVRDLAGRLLARGDVPIVYSPILGEIAAELRQAGIHVVDDLARLSVTPDLVHGHHEVPTMTALLHFGGVPGLFVCHDRRHHSDTPPRFPRLRRYVAVDHYTRERFREHGVAEDQIRVVPNGVDLERFRPRGPLPARPRRALVFSNNASERTHVPAVREACARAGLSLDVMGAASGRPCSRPEDVLGRYDIVLAKGRCALEAAAVGTAVIVCDALGAGPLATSDNVTSLLRFDGSRTQFEVKPVRPDVILEQIARYDPRDAAEVSRRIRAEADLERMVEGLVAIYREVLSEHAREPVRPEDERAAAAAYRRGSRLRRARLRVKRIPGVGRLLLALKQRLAPYRPAV